MLEYTLHMFSDYRRSRRTGFLRARSRSLPGKSRRRVLVVSTVLVSLFLFFLVASSLVGFAAFAFYSKDLPSPDKLTPTNWELSTKIFDRNGELLYDVHGEQNRTLVQLGELPDYVKSTALAVEDSEFYRHKGFDIRGITRSAYRLAVSGRIRGGGSTITQQLIKNALVGSERSYTRKIKELILALQVERRYSKDEILQMYLNNVPYGGQAWGIEAAAQMYFNKSSKELNLAEAALLAGLPQRPTAYSPFGAYPEAAKSRQEHVLKLMYERGWLSSNGEREYISKEAYEEALNYDLQYAQPGTDIKAAHFVMHVRMLLTERYGEQIVENGGLQVTTTLDYEKHKQAEEILAQEVARLASKRAGNAALVAMDPRTGEILSMVGSKDYFDLENDGNVNVTLRPRQPGSSIKPITYATAFKKGYTPATMVMDVRTEFPGGQGQPPYIPRNYDGTFHGPVLFRDALANSYNIPAVKVLGLVGIQSVLDTAHELGITTLNQPERYGLSLTLGGGEVKLLDMVTAFSVFANQGVKHEPVAILKVTDANGKVLEEHRATQGRRVLSEGISFLVADILSDDAARRPAFGYKNWLEFPNRVVAAKTGTTNDYRDAWTIGFTPSITIGVWAGNNDNSEMVDAPGSLVAAPIWHKVMEMWMGNSADEPFPQPDEITQSEICTLSGAPAHEGFPSKWEYFSKGAEPTGECLVHRRIEICEVDGKLAVDACRAAGKTSEENYLFFTALKPEWQDYVDAWVEAQEGEEYHPPTEESTAYFDKSGEEVEDGKPVVTFKLPEDDDKVSREFKVEVDVLTPYTVTKVQFLLDGVPVGDALTSIPYSKTYRLSDDMEGEHRITVRAVDSAGKEGSESITVRVVD